MNKLIPILIILGAAAAAIVGWKLVSTGQIGMPVLPGTYQATPTPVSVAPDATTNEMMGALEKTVDDGGQSDLLQLELEAKGL
ncbi:MAG: hypothetical protein Q7S31_02630 [bacterium]|nr:hypothetical protein [bacterium]